PDGASLFYAGYLGGAARDAGTAIAVDTTGNVYVVGSTASDQSSFPVAAGPDLSFGGNVDAFVAKFSGKPDLVNNLLVFGSLIVKPGAALSVGDTTVTLGLGTAPPSTTRHYLSLDTVKNPGDILLGGNHTVPSLPPGRLAAGPATSLIVPATTPPG